ncbi:DNA-directed RNA polymerase [Candidatus Woesearchaeota archaeon]|nr:DNA-directed RNA polymerase [Candidatus Woesearchaeota archaeon]
MRRNNRSRGGRDSSRGRDSKPRFGGGFRGGFRSFSGPRTMHKAVCAECGVECEVPFEPTEGRPVYCKECFAKHRPKRF